MEPQFYYLFTMHITTVFSHYKLCKFAVRGMPQLHFCTLATGRQGRPFYVYARV